MGQTSQEFKALRESKTFIHHLDATPAEIIPLLCPVREYEWIEGWQCRLIFSQSGVNETGCVFTTEFPEKGPGIWITTRHEPQAGAVEFAVFYPGCLLEKLEILVSPAPDGGSDVRWQRAFTGLSQAGNRLISDTILPGFRAQHQRLEKALAHFLAFGEMLKLSQAD